MTAIDKLRELNPVTDDEARELTRTKDLAWLDVLSKVQTTPQERPLKPKRRRRSLVVRRLVPALVTVALLGGIALTVLERTGDSRTVAAGPALAFSDEGRYRSIRIIDLEADSARFTKELKEHGLNFKIQLLAATPSSAGKLLWAGEMGDEGNDQFKVGEDPEGCTLGGPAPCAIEIKVPRDYTGAGELAIGRPMRPGEQAEQAGNLSDPGEPLAGVQYAGLSVGEVRALLEKRGYTVGKYVDGASGIDLAHSVPDNWFVTEGELVVDKQVALRVQEKLR
ncbi:hypothetical protein ACFCV3_02745 [Kribbella sp. NPDC056345]|uniref:hypothetical protein n=1 Tax=Kribbella sp. NPDC056345 TaxID=3345789 RepID=UPI0035E10977